MDIAVRLERSVDAVARSRAASATAIAVVALLCVVPGFFTLPVVEGGEPAYAVAARTMARTGDFITIHLFSGTPVLQWDARGGYWLPALMAMVFGEGAPMYVYRLPSLAAALATPVLTWWTALALIRNRGALLAGLFMAVGGVFSLQARLAMPEAVTLAGLVFGAGLLARVWIGALTADQTRLVAGVWVLLAVVFVMNGVVAAGPFLATMLALVLARPSFAATLRSSLGFAILAAAALLWLVISLIATLSGQATYLGATELARLGFANKAEAPPGIYLLLSPILVGPAMTFLFAGFAWILENAGRPVVVFLLAWMVPAWLFAEFAENKLPHLLLPVVPALCILAAMVTDRRAARIASLLSWLFSLGLLILPPLLAVGIITTTLYLEGTMSPWMVLWLAIGGVFGPIAWRWLRRGQSVASAIMAIATSLAIMWGIFGSTLPGLSGPWIAERLLAEGQVVSGCDRPLVAVAGYAEESVNFVFNDDAQLVLGGGAADFLNAGGDCRVAAVERGQISSFRQRADDLGLQLVDHARFAGVNFRKYVAIEMHVFTRAEATSP
ncbi:MAG: ArnT family glycosyltransferase [Alphaproteobacteria bacterium]